MIEHKLIRVAEDSPERCQAVVAHGQCPYGRFSPQTSYCKMHGGGRTNANEKEKSLRNYRFQRYAERINEKADSDIVKSLREEIGILRIVMEEIVNRCQDDTDLLIYSPKITDLTVKIEKLVTSCHKLETSLGQTLDKTAILNISTRIVNIVSEHIPDENLINEIVEEIGKMVLEA